MRKRGKGMACMFYPLGFTSYPNPGAAFVKMNPDGSATVLTGATDIGQGSTTVLGQIAAEELGIAFDRITMVMGDTGICPVDSGTVASRVTFIVGNAIRRAAAQAKAILFEVASEELGVGPEGLEARDGRIFVAGLPERSCEISRIARKAELGRGRPAIGCGSYNPPSTFLDPETGQGKPYAAYVYAAQVAEVEVDTETGEVTVLKVTAVHDCGTAVNPAMVEGQVHGGVCMGVGYCLTEEVCLDSGVPVNANLSDYVVPTALDAPEIDVDIVEHPDPGGPFGAKGIGEPSLLPTAPAISNAIYDAVGVRIRELPATPEAVLAAIKAKEAGR